ncbi:MAG: TVP38/TMEM64 family protein [Clostridia bacterium]|nr:TVP38/TMEM64 family protein [Clostridia bacterium]
MGKKREKVKRLFADKPLKETKHYSKRYAATVLSVISVCLCVLSVLGFIFIKTRFSDTDAIKAWVDENYLIAAVVMTLLCAVQVVIALIPGELLEIASGYAFGGVMGAVICTVGILLGSVVAILLARRLGRRFVESLYPREKIDAIPILNDPKRRNAMTFLLFLIPGTPKDLFTYVIGMTEMSIPLYIVLTMFARLPSIVMSTLGGGALGSNKLMLAVVIFIVAAVVSACGYLIYLTIQNRHRKKTVKDK